MEWFVGRLHLKEKCPLAEISVSNVYIFHSVNWNQVSDYEKSCLYRVIIRSLRNLLNPNYAHLTFYVLEIMLSDKNNPQKLLGDS